MVLLGLALAWVRTDRPALLDVQLWPVADRGDVRGLLRVPAAVRYPRAVRLVHGVWAHDRGRPAGGWWASVSADRCTPAALTAGSAARRTGDDPRRSVSTSRALQSDSIHQVAPAAAWAPGHRPAAAGSPAGVVPSTTMSNGPVRPARRTLAAQPADDLGQDLGAAGLPVRRPSAWTTIPSQRAARRIERACGHAPTTQMGIRGRWTGVGGTSSVRIGSARRRSRTARRSRGRRGWRASRRGVAARTPRLGGLAHVAESLVVERTEAHRDDKPPTREHVERHRLARDLPRASPEWREHHRAEA